MQADGLMMIEALVLKKCASFATFFNNTFPGHHNMAVDNAEHVQFTDHLPQQISRFCPTIFYYHVGFGYISLDFLEISWDFC